MGMKPNDPNMEGRTSLISAGDVKLYSYDSAIDQTFMNIKINRGSPRHLVQARDFQSGETLQAIQSSKMNLLNGISRFSVSVDGIFFDDGTFAGADTFFYFDSMRGRIEAHKDLISLLSESASHDALSETLIDYVARNGFGDEDRDAVKVPKPHFNKDMKAVRED